MSSGWVHISLLPVPYPYIEIRENLNSYPNPIKSEKTRQIGIGLDGYPRARVLLPCLISIENLRESPLILNIYSISFMYTTSHLFDMILLSKPQIPLESSTIAKSVCVVYGNSYTPITELHLSVILIMARRNVEKGEVG